MSAFREAFDARPHWIPSEAPSSLHLHGDCGPPTSGEGGPVFEGGLSLDSTTPLPTMHTISGLDHDRLTPSSSTTTTERIKQNTIPSSYKTVRPSLRHEAASKSEGMAPSRRSSTASVTKFFNAIPDSNIRVDWPSKESWLHVERNMGDVINAELQAARALAETMGPQSPERPKQYLASTTSGVGMAGAMGIAARNRLMKRESVLVKRKKSNMDLQAEEQPPAVPPLPSTVSKSGKLARKNKPPKLEDVQIYGAQPVDYNGIVVQSPDASVPDSPTLLSQCSCTDASHGGSSSSPGGEGLHRPSLDSSSQREYVLVEGTGTYKPQRSRSLIDNVRGFFQQPNVPLSRTVSISRLPPPQAIAPLTESVVAGPSSSSSRGSPTVESVRRRWRQSIRRRVGSDSKVPSSEHPTASTSEPYLLGRGSFLETIHSPGDELDVLEGIMTPRDEGPLHTMRPRMAGEHARHTWHIDDFPTRGYRDALERRETFAAFVSDVEQLVSSPGAIASASNSVPPTPPEKDRPDPLQRSASASPLPQTPSTPSAGPAPPSKKNSSSRLMSFFSFSRAPDE